MIIVGSWRRGLSLDLCRGHPKSRAVIVAGAPPRRPCGGGCRAAAMYVPGSYLWQRGAGAIDIIVVRQQNGSFKSSPWKVRFGRLQGEVELQVNGVPALFRMLLDPNGNAYFPNPNPEFDLSTNSDTNPSTNPNTNPNSSANPSTKPNTKSNPKTNPNPSSNPSTNPNHTTNPNTNPNLSTNPNTNPNPSTNPSGNPKTNPNPSGNPKTNYSTNPITNPNPNANPSTDVSPNIKPSTNPIPNINPNPSSSPSTNPDINPSTNPSTDPDTNPNPNTDPKPDPGPEWLPELKKLTSFESAEIVVDLLDTWSTGNPKQDGKKLQPSTRDATIGKEKVGDHGKNSSEIVRGLNPAAEPYTLLEDLAVLLSQIAEENASAEEMQREIMALKDESVSETVPIIPTSTDEATSEMVLLSVDGHVLTAPVSDGIELVLNPKIGNAETALNSAEPLQNGLIGLENLPNTVLYSSPPSPTEFYDAIAVGDSAASLLEGSPQTMDSIGNSSKKNVDKSNATLWMEDLEGIGNKLLSTGLEISLCRHLLQEGMGLEAASEAFSSRKVSLEEFSALGRAILANDQLVARIGSRYFPWMEVAPAIIGTLAFRTKFASHTKEGLIPVQSKETAEGGTLLPVRSNWLSWSFPFRKPTNNNLSLETPSPQFADNLSRKTGLYKSGWRSEAYLYVPTSEQLALLNLREGENKITFTVSTGVLGKQQQVDARIYLWNWNTRIVISDVDGTITKSDVLGHVMPLVGRDWSQLGVTRLFSAIKENGYEILFLSARAITQACGTRQFLLNLKQDGEMLPQGPVVISPDGLFPSLYREVVRRAPHEFKISCLKEIREIFPADINPFYAGFGNRQTDEISYLQVGVPKGKIFIINPKGEVVVNHRVDVKSYTSLHTLVNDMFPAMSTSEQEDFNSWNFWKMPLPDIKDEIAKLGRLRKK